MEHWNGNQVCVIDTETSGLDSYWHEILQIALVPLDSNFEPRKDILPFYIEMKPENPERIDPEAMAVNKMKLCTIMERGFDQEKAKDLLLTWKDKLELPYTKGGQHQKRIIPLGQNYAFDQAFIKQWLGVDMYNECFDGRYMDTMVAATYLNDRAAMHSERVPFPKLNLKAMAARLKIEHGRAHDALQDCVTTAKVYKALTTRGLLG